MDILRQLGIGVVASGERRRVVLVMDWPEHGGARVRDAKDLEGDDLRWLWGEVRRLSARNMHRTGVLKRMGRKGTVRVVPEPVAPIIEGPSSG